MSKFKLTVVTPRLFNDILVHFFATHGIDIRVIQKTAKCGWGGVPWVHFELLDTEKRRATFLGKKEFGEAALDYIFRFCLFQIFVNSASGIGQTLLKIGKGKRSSSIDCPKTVGIVNGKLDYLSEEMSKEQLTVSNEQ